MLAEQLQQKIRETCSRKICLEIYYAKVNGERKRYELVPVSIRQNDGNQMLYGFDLAESKTKAFKFSNIISAESMSRKPWPETIKEQVGHRLELEVSDSYQVPKSSGILLKPSLSKLPDQSNQ